MYRLKQASHNWYKRLYDELISTGFTQSKVDKCLLIRHDCIIVIYVDNCLIFSKDEAVLDSIVQHLGATFRITSEADVGAYLGLDIRRTSAGFLENTQPGLIDKVIVICGTRHLQMLFCMRPPLPTSLVNYNGIIGK
jgi:hypothetical protein